MTVNHSYFISRHTPLVAIVVLWIYFTTVNGARDSRSSFSTSLLDTKDPQILDLDSDNIVLLSARDLSPDIVATAVPVSSFASKTGAQPRPENNDLHLRSSSRNVSGVAGFRLYSLPIVVSELADLLTDTRTDLQNHDSSSATSFYQFKTKKWSFFMITANSSVHYIYIQAVVSHFTKLLSVSSSLNDITSTRVGVILNGSIPIADVIIMPLPNATNHAHIPFSSFGISGNISSSQPIEISTVTPFGSSCSYQIVNESAALVPFKTSSLQPRSLETEVLARVGRTAFAISVRLLLDPNGLPTEVKVSAAVAMVFIALIRLDFAYMEATAPAIDTAKDKAKGKTSTLDTEFFDLVQQHARLIMEITKGDSEGKTIELSLNTWKAMLMLLANPLWGMNTVAKAWAMQGDIYGPENGDQDDGRNNSQVRLGRWELYFGGQDEL